MARNSTRPTIIDIAKRAEVSFKTVSRVLNNNPRVAAELRDRVHKAMAELDYRPNIAARSLAGQRGYAIAMLASRREMPAEDDRIYIPPFLSELQAGALLASQSLGYHFFVELIDFQAADLEALIQRQLAAVGVDGLLLAPPAADDVRLLDVLDAFGKPYVRLAPGVDVDRSPAVAIDEFHGALAMMEHLIGLGHRNIGFVGGPAQHIAAKARHDAYRAALADLPDAGPERTEEGDFAFASGLEAGTRLLAAAPRPTAIFAANDDMAAGVLAAAARAGVRVPDELSVAGFDDSLTARITWPPLTTIRQPVASMAREAVGYLVELAADRKPAAQQIILPFTLIERGSTGPVPG